jgi:outer membrane protein assembly factor BamB
VGQLYAFEKGGALRWKLAIKDPYNLNKQAPTFGWEAPPTIDDQGHLCAIATRTGAESTLHLIDPGGSSAAVLQRVDLGPAGIDACPAVPALGPAIVCAEDGRFLRVDRRTGAVDSNYMPVAAGPGTTRVHYTSPAVRGTTLVVAGTFTEGQNPPVGRVFGVEYTTGKLLWLVNGEGPEFTSPAIDDAGRAFIATTTGRVLAIDAASGARLWTYPGTSPIRGSVACGRFVFFGTVGDASGKSGTLVALDRASGGVFRSWAMRAPVATTPALGADGTIYVATEGGIVYALADPLPGGAPGTKP